MKKLIAKYPILHQSTQYQVGDELPTGDTSTVKEWNAAGTAVWIGEDEPKAAKANLKTATPGQPGKAVGGEQAEENLVGKVPKTPARNKGGQKNGKKIVQGTPT